MSTSTQQGTGNWTIDPAHSQVEFGVRHMMISTVKGYFPGISGTIRLNEENPSASSVEVELDAASVDTRNADRDGHLRSGDFFDVEKYPSLTFRSTLVERSGDDLTVVGDLTIRGVTRSVTLKAEELGRGVDPWGNPRVGFQARTTISRKDFGLTWNQTLEAGGVLVGDDIRISIEVQAVPATEESEG